MECVQSAKPRLSCGECDRCLYCLLLCSIHQSGLSLKMQSILPIYPSESWGSLQKPADWTAHYVNERKCLCLAVSACPTQVRLELFFSCAFAGSSCESGGGKKRRGASSFEPDLWERHSGGQHAGMHRTHGAPDRHQRAGGGGTVSLIHFRALESRLAPIRATHQLAYPRCCVSNSISHSAFYANNQTSFEKRWRIFNNQIKCNILLLIFGYIGRQDGYLRS